jgi:hypothetical protein
MTMRRTDRFAALTSIPEMIPWLLRLTTRMLARSLNMPEPLLHHTGLFVFAQVAAFEYSLGKSLCPRRLLRFFRDPGAESGA